MPNIKLPYNPQGIELSNRLAEEVKNVGGEIVQDMPTNDAMERNTNMDMPTYEAGGKANIDAMGYYKGGQVGDGPNQPMDKTGIGGTQFLDDAFPYGVWEKGGKVKNK
tara:strand:- start:204 stop:527 length:324 start_codon:yes stop_codon:yes gene_type:complete